VEVPYKKRKVATVDLGKHKEVGDCTPKVEPKEVFWWVNVRAKCKGKTKKKRRKERKKKEGDP